jgi:hypothetical protein
MLVISAQWLIVDVFPYLHMCWNGKRWIDSLFSKEMNIQQGE